MRGGTVLAAYGRQFLVLPDESDCSVRAVSKGRNADVAVGDRVDLSDAGKDQMLIASVHTRRNALKRSTDRRSKVLAANIDQTALVLAPEPAYSESIVLRVGIAAASEGISLLIIANKSDSPAFAGIASRLALFEQLGLPVIPVSAREQPEDCRQKLSALLTARTTLLLGESGMGKSTILNLLVPDAQQRTGEFSRALQSGRHTTTFSRMFSLPNQFAHDARLIDSPGFQQFGIAHLSASEREHGMPDFAPWLGQCRFNNCTHQAEPGCAIRQAVERGEIDAIRYKIFIELYAEYQDRP